MYLLLLNKTTANAEEIHLSDEIMSTTKHYGDMFGLDPDLIRAVIWVESHGISDAKNKSCYGLGQVNPYVWHEEMDNFGYKKSDIYDVEVNIHMTTYILYEYLWDYETETERDVSYALDLYNGNTKAKYYHDRGIKSSYVKKVMKAKKFFWENRPIPEAKTYRLLEDEIQEVA